MKFSALIGVFDAECTRERHRLDLVLAPTNPGGNFQVDVLESTSNLLKSTSKRGDKLKVY